MFGAIMIRNREGLIPLLTKDGSTVREYFNPASSSLKNLSLAEAFVAPGSSTMPHIHNDSQEIYYILEGEGVMALGDGRINVIAGDAILIMPGTAHQIIKTGEKGLKILCICSPPYSHDDTELI
jgi:mannose-6-phosphate isomerase-like protein (cupin superfamily)